MGLRVSIMDCWVLLYDVGCCYCCSLFSKFRMLYHCVFLRFLFVASRMFGKMSQSKIVSSGSVSGGMIFVKHQKMYCVWITNGNIL